MRDRARAHTQKLKQENYPNLLEPAIYRYVLDYDFLIYLIGN